MKKVKLLVGGMLMVASFGQLRAQVLQAGSDKDILKTRQGNIVELPGFLTEKELT